VSLILVSNCPALRSARSRISQARRSASVFIFVSNWLRSTVEQRGSNLVSKLVSNLPGSA
jgi:hypothetical protein